FIDGMSGVKSRPRSRAGVSDHNWHKLQTLRTGSAVFHTPPWRWLEDWGVSLREPLTKISANVAERGWKA
ncbi:MAG TPA: hypothetical protein VIM69_00580, partial [Opitutaceae bacterium]